MPLFFKKYFGMITVSRKGNARHIANEKSTPDKTEVVEMITSNLALASEKKILVIGDSQRCIVITEGINQQ